MRNILLQGREGIWDKPRTRLSGLEETFPNKSGLTRLQYDKTSEYDMGGLNSVPISSEEFFMSTALPSSELLTRDEAAAVSRREAADSRCLASNHRYHLPLIKVGTKVRYRKSDLDAWLAIRTVGGAEQGE